MVTSIHSYTISFCLFDNNVAEISVTRNEMRKGYMRDMFFVTMFRKVCNVEEAFEVLKEKCKEFNTETGNFQFSVCSSGIGSYQNISKQDSFQKAMEKFMIDFRESYPRKKLKFVRYVA